MKGSKVYLRTFGCQMNVLEGDFMKRTLEALIKLD